MVLVGPRKTSPDITEKNVDWDVKNQIKQNHGKESFAEYLHANNMSMDPILINDIQFAPFITICLGSRL